MVETHPLVLSLRSAGLKDIDPCNIEDVHSMWHAFSKAKHCIDGGDRFEYLSWRLYSREILLRGKTQKKAQLDSLRPEAYPLASDADSLVEHNTSSGEEWESGSEGSSASDNDLNSFSPQSAKTPSPNVTDTQNESALYGHKHRRISSLELQNLFNDRKASSNSSSRNIQNHIKSEKASPKTILKKSSTASPETHGIVHRARFRSPQFELHTDNFRASSRSDSVEANSIPSSVIRGFSPSNVSVSVSNKHGRNELDPLSVVREATETSSSVQSENISDNTKKSHPKSKDNRRMFYICAADSDSESSNMGSPEKSTKHGNRQSKTLDDVADDIEITPRNPEKAAGHVDEENRAFTGSPIEFAEGSDWADTSDEDLEDECTEESRQEMFKERAVPTKPLLKRSLLSSLFVSKVKVGKPSQSDSLADSSEERRTPEANRTEVSAPVDILLGAPLAPHFPLPSEQNMLKNESFGSTHTNIIGGGIMEQREQEQLQQLSRSLDSNNSTPTHITGRPEIYRASTEDPTHTPKPDTMLVQSSWANQHEDIYDPMNYHSRGW